MPPTARKPSPKPRENEEKAETTEDETPIHDQLVQDLKNADPEDVTLFEEDDDPLSHVGELVDEDETEEKETQA